MTKQLLEREKIVANDATDKGLISKKYTSHRTQQQQQQTIKKWTEDLNRHYYKKKTYGWPLGIWKDAQHFSLLEKCK